MENIKGKVENSLSEVTSKGKLLVTKTLNLEGNKFIKKYLIIWFGFLF